ncbi:hypothetical protein DPMN_125497 [Dreissena polymorpha]|uniref:Uncharacterized protein n=1 Tax=Dreissena polymorpha TaxID=45954 RepID=A0A9D4JUS0_DREPO|nr:hypothetical protein DPMN_156041 [Dreissena polymorpha]KAH3823684.1 hypothetical protein DPMN_125497 [Dreissena polymorpha]
MPDGNDEYDHTTNTLSSESDSRKRDNIYNKPKIERHGAYDHTGRLENNMTRTGDDYDTTNFVGRNDDVSDYNHVVSTTVTRGYGKNNYEQGGYDLFHGIKTKLPQCDDTDYAHANI